MIMMMGAMIMMMGASQNFFLSFMKPQRSFNKSGISRVAPRYF